MKKVLALALALVLALGCASFAMAEEEKPLIGILAPATTHGWVGGVAYFAEQAAEELDLNYVMLTSSTADEMSSHRRVAAVHRRGSGGGNGPGTGHHHLQLRYDHRCG